MSTTINSALLASAALLLGTGAASAQQDATKIGALIPLTGGLQAYGEATQTGIQLAVKQANETGGVLGGAVEVVTADTQTKAQPAIDAANRLVSIENVAGIIGPMSSGNTIPVATSVTAVESVPQISNSATAPTITALDDDDFLFRTAPSDSGQGTVLGNLVIEQGTESVAVIYVNNDYGQGLAEAFEASFAEAGGTVTSSSAFEPNVASYRGELQGLAGDDAEALVVIAYPDDGGLLILRQALEEGFFESFIFTDGMKAVQIPEQLGEFVEGMYGTAPKAAESTANDSFAQAYEQEYGEVPPLPYIAEAYDATTLLLLAIESAGTTEDGAAIRDALRAVATAPGEKVGPGDFAKAKELLAQGQEIDYDGASGSVDFDAAGDVPGSYEHWAIEGGELVTVNIIE